MKAVDELSYRRGQCYLANVADHHSGRIIWSAPGRNAQTLQEFFDLLGERKHSFQAVSIDMSLREGPVLGSVSRAAK